jgi:hypothetical protein
MARAVFVIRVENIEGNSGALRKRIVLALFHSVGDSISLAVLRDGYESYINSSRFGFFK